MNPVLQYITNQTIKTWEGDRDPSKQVLAWYGDGPVPERFKQIWDWISQMEEYLEDLDLSLKMGKSVTEVLWDRFQYIIGDKALFQFIMSYRWGQDNGADVNKLSALFQDEYYLFNSSEDLPVGGMGQIIQKLALNA